MENNTSLKSVAIFHFLKGWFILSSYNTCLAQQLKLAALLFGYPFCELVISMKSFILQDSPACRARLVFNWVYDYYHHSCIPQVLTGAQTSNTPGECDVAFDLLMMRRDKDHFRIIHSYFSTVILLELPVKYPMQGIVHLLSMSISTVCSRTGEVSTGWAPEPNEATESHILSRTPYYLIPTSPLHSNRTKMCFRSAANLIK